jgi:hypothetical protein
MRWCLISGALTLALFTTSNAQPVAELAQKKGWLTDYAAAKATARQSGKPLMVVFRCQP